MKIVSIFLLCCVLLSCATPPTDTQGAPVWLNSLERAYPSREWVAVTAEGAGRPQAEAAAMNALARAFRTDVASLTQMSQRFSRIVDSASGSRTIAFNESENFRQDVSTTTNIKGLIGVQIDIYRAPDNTVYICARMNRRECAARYSGMIRENAAIINTLLAAASPIQGTFDVYSRLSFAHAIAEVTDNFQNILEVLDTSAVSRKPAYGGAAAIRTKMIECASLITIGITVNTEQQADRTLLTRAAGSFFRDLGVRSSTASSGVDQQSQHGVAQSESQRDEQRREGFIPSSAPGYYVLRVNARFETIRQNVVSCRYYLDAVLENANRAAIFSFTEDDRKAHPNMESEARRLAVSAAETSFKEGKFAQEFESWLNSLIE